MMIASNGLVHGEFWSQARVAKQGMLADLLSPIGPAKPTKQTQAGPKQD
jgi:hypothetical protein